MKNDCPLYVHKVQLYGHKVDSSACPADTFLTNDFYITESSFTFLSQITDNFNYIRIKAFEVHCVHVLCVNL